MLSTPKSSLQIHRINNPTATTSANNINMTCQKQSHHPPPRRAVAALANPPVPEAVARYHAHSVGPNQCCSAVVQHVAAPIPTVWSVVRRFDKPQVYKHFVKSCDVIVGDGDVGSLREVRVITGLPAACSTERLEILDEEKHVLSFSVVGGDHRLSNYRSITTLHSAPTGSGTVVVESYVVDVPAGNTKEETCVFIDTIVRCNLQSLAQIVDNSSVRPRS